MVGILLDSFDGGVVIFPVALRSKICRYTCIIFIFSHDASYNLKDRTDQFKFQIYDSIFSLQGQ